MRVPELGRGLSQGAPISEGLRFRRPLPYIFTACDCILLRTRPWKACSSVRRSSRPSIPSRRASARKKPASTGPERCPCDANRHGTAGPDRGRRLSPRDAARLVQGGEKPPAASVRRRRAQQRA
jgi:hypothetical protein